MVEKGKVEKLLVKQVREAAFHIKDAIDEYMLHVACQRDQHGFTVFLHNCSFGYEIATTP